jgi:hypothetical protein
MICERWKTNKVALATVLRKYSGHGNEFREIKLRVKRLS